MEEACSCSVPYCFVLHPTVPLCCGHCGKPIDESARIRYANAIKAMRLASALRHEDYYSEEPTP